MLVVVKLLVIVIARVTTSMTIPITALLFGK